MRPQVLVVLTLGLLAAPSPVSAMSSGAEIGEDCSFEGIRLYGKVKVVQSFADVEVEVVDHFPDLKVRAVEHFPDRCGEWQFVESFPDFTIKYVESFADVQIRMVEHFPGKP